MSARKQAPAGAAGTDRTDRTDARLPAADAGSTDARVPAADVGSTNARVPAADVGSTNARGLPGDPQADGLPGESQARGAPLRINIITIFPDFFASPLALSIPARAAAAGGVEYRVIDLRDFTHDKHRTVDDYPYGGGPGMVMKPGPFFEAIDALGAGAPIVLLSARGRQFAQADAARFAAGRELTLLCGHYKDVDQRVADHLATEELSLGPFVLSGGEPAALAIIDAVVRLRPGAMSDLESAHGDSWWSRELSAPSYTRPPVYRGHAVPEVLLSGDHQRIAAWRRAEGERLSRERPDAISRERPDTT